MMKRNILGFLFLFCSQTCWAQETTGSSPITLNIFEIFWAAPVIYTILISLSLIAFILWLYSLLTLKLSEMMPTEFSNKIREQLAGRHFEAALKTCHDDDHFVSPIIANGIASRNHGPQVMMEAMQSEGRRRGSSLWQRISLLSDIAIVAPMLGLLGTVLGLFFAFYDVNRTPESIANIFDGLGIAVGTTVAGLIVAILAMIFYTTLKFRVVNLLNAIENEAMALVNMIELSNKENTTTGASS